MKNILLLTSAIILCSITACNKGDIPGAGSNSIIGKWRWVKSVGGIGGFTITPQSSGYSIRNEFYADSSFKRFKNDSLQISGNFRTIKDYKYSPTQTVNILSISGPALDTHPVSYLIRNDSLYLNDIYIADGYNDVYVRTK
ncbi:hypothetical protein SAMN05192574_105112 [Mucilaginibacter gossypiicola]|uniref:Lipocalin-like domain-containing protein n=1 Tax=Mucilaginibacter gossypiicola TaxID=551995 RepID=A0A1H8LIF4_9SPHI|nr:hypothetical protein [Mucilaginibacter gossypiicola]SEO04941.1 hypothetical protein SAMN05192574_105112 [Mucilaginibacter gossypiicola]